MPKQPTSSPSPSQEPTVSPSVGAGPSVDTTPSVDAVGLDAAGNPLLHVSSPIAFDKVRTEHMQPAIDALLRQCEAALQALEAAGDDGAPLDASILHRYDRITESLDRASTLMGHLESVATTPALREVYNAVQPRLAAFYGGIVLRPKLWQLWQRFHASDAAKRLAPSEQRLLTQIMDNFARQGANLPPAQQATLRSIDVALSKATTSFAQHVLDSTASFSLVIDDPAALAGLPESAIAAAKKNAEDAGKHGWRFTLQAPSYLPVMTYAENRSLRETLWRAQQKRASEAPHDNRPLIERILRLRHARARLLGFAHFADLVLADRMAGTGTRASEFLEDLRAQSCETFAAENQALQAFATAMDMQHPSAKHAGTSKEESEGELRHASLSPSRASATSQSGAHPSAGTAAREATTPPEMASTMAPWDLAFFAERMRKALLDFDEELLRPYFEVRRVMQGLFSIATSLYGIAIKPIDIPVWHPSVEAFEVRNEAGEVIGQFYADLYPRDEKRDGAWMNAFITGAPPHSPHVGLFCGNMTPPDAKGQSLLSHRDVETMFHEFGHLLHHLLSEEKLYSMSGTNVAWDFVELPSQIMENWCWERASLDMVARHHETGATIPEDLLQSLRQARTFRSANAMMRQLGLASVDLALHIDYPVHAGFADMSPEALLACCEQAESDPSVFAEAAMDEAAMDQPAPPTGHAGKQPRDACAFVRPIHAKYAGIELPEDYLMIPSFSHIFSSSVGYACGYYSYKWAEVLDADAFGRFASEGLLSRDVGESFRTCILARGDSDDPRALFRAFMGRDPRPDALLERAGLKVKAADNDTLA